MLVLIKQNNTQAPSPRPPALPKHWHINIHLSASVAGIMEILTTSSLNTDVVTPETMNDSVVTATGQLATSQLMAFGLWYQSIHGYVCIFVCTFGIAANVMNIIVLTRRNMVSQFQYSSLLLLLLLA